MGIKAFNHGDDFVNKFIRAIVSDSTGADAIAGAPPPPPAGVIATGGVVNEYTTSPGVIYRSHIFTSSGSFDVTQAGTDDTADILLVGGGGGGGGAYSGG